MQDLGYELLRIPLLETVWKLLSGRNGGLRCAPWRAGDTLPICPRRNGVASARIFRNPQRTRTPHDPRFAGDPRRPLLRAKERLSLAVAGEGVPTVEDRLRVLQQMAHRWDVGAPEHLAARAATMPPWQGSQP